MIDKLFFMMLALSDLITEPVTGWEVIFLVIKTAFAVAVFGFLLLFCILGYGHAASHATVLVPIFNALIAKVFAVRSHWLWLLIGLFCFVVSSFIEHGYPLIASCLSFLGSGIFILLWLPCFIVSRHKDTERKVD